MAEAKLAITVEDAGPSPVGGLAPPGVSPPPPPQEEPGRKRRKAQRDEDTPLGSVQDLLREVANLPGLKLIASAGQSIIHAIQKAQSPDVISGKTIGETKMPDVPPGSIPPGSAQGVAASIVQFAKAAAPVAAAVAAVAALGFVAKKTGDAFDAMARNLSQYSGELAGSTARADIRRMQSEMDRARSVGPGLSRMQDDWSRMMGTFSAMGTSIIELLTKLYELFRPFVQIVQVLLDVIAAALEVIVDLIKIVVDVMTLQWKEVPADLKEMWSDMNKWLKKIADNFGSEDPLGEDEFLNSLFGSIGGFAGKAKWPPMEPIGRWDDKKGVIWRPGFEPGG